MSRQLAYGPRVLRAACWVLLVGCAGAIGDTAPDPFGDAGPGSGSGDGAPTAVARAQAWVDAMVPYCQAANHEPDLDPDCPSTCTRPDNPDWDAYRSDCSGLVSWAWGLPAPGHTTATLAPFDDQVSQAISADELAPGDAINNDHHTMVFAGWLEIGTRARFLEEPGCSADQPYAREYIANVTLDGDTVEVSNRGLYTAIRRLP
jgi:hypothetical protein